MGPQAYWITSSQIMKSIENIINYLHGELAAVFGLVALTGTIFTFLRFFFFIFFCDLIPVIVIIETVSNVIRPGTLSIRLAANIVAGHLLLTLLGSQGPNAQGIVLLVLIGRLILLLCLELAVACIQAYVFTILRSLYLNELRTVSFNKNIS